MYGTLSNRNNASHMKKYLNLDHVRKVTTQISPRISKIRSNFNCISIVGNLDCVVISSIRVLLDCTGPNGPSHVTKIVILLEISLLIWSLLTQHPFKRAVKIIK